MSVDEKIMKRFDALVREGDDLAAREKVDSQQFTQWFTSCKHFIGLVAGKESEHCQKFAEVATGMVKDVWSALAILRAAQQDYLGGWLVDFRELAAAEVFDDFLEMAEHLCQHGYHIPAASVAGAVLEDSLRRLHLKKIGQWSGESGISKLNDSLHKAGVYAQPEWRQVQVWGDIRNEADHAHFEKVDATGVAQMISGIRDFIVKHLT